MNEFYRVSFPAALYKPTCESLKIQKLCHEKSTDIGDWSDQGSNYSGSLSFSFLICEKKKKRKKKLLLDLED